MWGWFPLHWRWAQFHHFTFTLSWMSWGWKNENKNSPTGKSSESFLAFLATFKQRLHNHIYAMFQSLGLSISCQQPRWKAEAHKDCCRTAFVQGGSAQDHFKYALHCMKLWCRNKWVPFPQQSQTLVLRLAPAKLTLNLQQSFAEISRAQHSRWQFSLVFETGAETHGKEDRK